MQFWLAALLGGLVQIAGSLVGRVLLALGISYVTYTGLDLVLSSLFDQAMAGISGTGSVIVGILGLLKVGTGLSIIASAYAARAALVGLQAGAVTRMRIGQ